ncbi:MAG: alpha/beta hydrolase [Burkholderiaceae bacterium]|nr:MAG: alpha/beta hydrolase [Burkholderiaceae bacterium]
MRRLAFPTLVASLVLCPMMALAAQPHLALAQSLSQASERSEVQTSAQTQAQEGWVQLDIGRGQARLPTYVMPHPGAKATLILLPGGDGGTGKVAGGLPTSHNFLSRSRAHFHAEGFNVIVAYRASDLPGLEYGYRISPEHVAELSAVVDHAHRAFGVPVWLVGTSRGSVSATAATIALGAARMQGLVLTSSVTSKKPGAVPTQDLARIQVPTLVVHHRDDACHVCLPREAARIPDALTASPRKQFILIEGGSDPQGDPCEASHWHGFIGYEKETVGVIARWIRDGA